MKLKQWAVALILLFASAFAAAQTTTYTLGGETCQASGAYPVASPYQFNCNGIPVLNVNGSVQLDNAGRSFQVHIPNLITEPNQYLKSKFYPVTSAFSTPVYAKGKLITPGTDAYNYQITDANGNIFHGTISFQWYDIHYYRWYYPQILTTFEGNTINGSLTVSSGPLQ